MRSCDDIDEQALSYAEIKALCAGDPRIREKMDLDVQVAKLKVLRGDFQNQKYRLEDKLLKTFPEEIQKQKTRIAALQQDSQIAAAWSAIINAVSKETSVCSLMVVQLLPQ